MRARSLIKIILLTALLVGLAAVIYKINAHVNKEIEEMTDLSRASVDVSAAVPLDPRFVAQGKLPQIDPANDPLAPVEKVKLPPPQKIRPLTGASDSIKDPSTLVQ